MPAAASAREQLDQDWAQWEVVLMQTMSEPTIWNAKIKAVRSQMKKLAVRGNQLGVVAPPRPNTIRPLLMAMKDESTYESVRQKVGQIYSDFPAPALPPSDVEPPAAPPLSSTSAAPKSVTSSAPPAKTGNTAQPEPSRLVTAAREKQKAAIGRVAIPARFALPSAVARNLQTALNGDSIVRQPRPEPRNASAGPSKNRIVPRPRHNKSKAAVGDFNNLDGDDPRVIKELVRVKEEEVEKRRGLFQTLEEEEDENDPEYRDSGEDERAPAESTAESAPESPPAKRGKKSKKPIAVKSKAIIDTEDDDSGAEGDDADEDEKEKERQATKRKMARDGVAVVEAKVRMGSRNETLCQVCAEMEKVCHRVISSRKVSACWECKKGKKGCSIAAAERAQRLTRRAKARMASATRHLNPKREAQDETEDQSESDAAPTVPAPLADIKMGVLRNLTDRMKVTEERTIDLQGHLKAAIGMDRRVSKVERMKEQVRELEVRLESTVQYFKQTLARMGETHAIELACMERRIRAAEGRPVPDHQTLYLGKQPKHNAPPRDMTPVEPLEQERPLSPLSALTLSTAGTAHNSPPPSPSSIFVAIGKEGQEVVAPHGQSAVRPPPASTSAVIPPAAAPPAATPPPAAPSADVLEGHPDRLNIPDVVPVTTSEPSAQTPQVHVDGPARVAADGGPFVTDADVQVNQTAEVISPPAAPLPTIPEDVEVSIPSQHQAAFPPPPKPRPGARARSAAPVDVERSMTRGLKRAASQAPDESVAGPSQPKRLRSSSRQPESAVAPPHGKQLRSSSRPPR